METVSLHYHWGAMTISVYHKVKQQVQSCNCFGYKRDSTTVHDDSNISDSNLFGSKRIRIQPWQRVSGGSAFQEKWLLLQSQINRLYLSYHMKVVINSVSLSRTYCAPQQVGALAHCTKWRWSHLWCTEGFFVVARRCLFFHTTTERVVLMSIGTPCTGYL